jgi:PIN domain nuclease of toxin-antitoxin system
VRLLLDTHVLLWGVLAPQKLSQRTRKLLDDRANTLVFSVVNIWEIVIKRSLGRDDLEIDPRAMRRGLIDNGYEELPIAPAHALALDDLPPLHKDPFDRMLIAQSRVEGLALLTADKLVLQYPGTLPA